MKHVSLLLRQTSGTSLNVYFKLPLLKYILQPYTIYTQSTVLDFVKLTQFKVCPKDAGLT